MRLIKISMCLECPYYCTYPAHPGEFHCLQNCNIRGIIWRPDVGVGKAIHEDCPLEKVPRTEEAK